MASDGEVLSDRDDETPATAAGPSAEMPTGWEQRILQLAGKRYSLRLEPEFWSALETIATRRKLRLNRLVAEVASRRPVAANLSSTLRTFCLGEIERSAAARSVALDSASIAALIEGAPVPGLVLDFEHIVLAVNDAFLHWSGLKRTLLLRQKIGRHFRFQGSGNLDVLWSTPAGAEQTRIVGIMPGRVLAAEVSLVPLLSARGRRLCGLWVKP